MTHHSSENATVEQLGKIRFRWIFTALLTLFSLLGLTEILSDDSENKTQQRPNILLLVADDMGFNSIPVNFESGATTVLPDAVDKGWGKFYVAPFFELWLECFMNAVTNTTITTTII